MSPTTTEAPDIPDNEIWETIPDWPDYAISNLGIVKRIVNRQCSKIGRIIRQYNNKQGYCRVPLSKNATTKWLFVHRLVLTAFKGKSSLHCNHINGKKADNRLENLEYVTAHENMIHAFKIGLISAAGSKNPAAKLTEDLVLIIRHMFPIYKRYELADMFGVHEQTIGKIVNRKVWTHI